MNPAIVEFRDHLTALKYEQHSEGRKLTAVRVPVLLYRMLKMALEAEPEVYAAEIPPNDDMLMLGVRIEPDGDLSAIKPVVK